MAGGGVGYAKRLKVLMRDGFRCRYCGREMREDETTRRNKNNVKLATVDHVVPRILGGTHRLDNLVAACFHCNQLKGDRTLDESGMTILPIDPSPGKEPLE